MATFLICIHASSTTLKMGQMVHKFLTLSVARPTAEITETSSDRSAFKSTQMTKKCTNSAVQMLMSSTMSASRDLLGKIILQITIPTPPMPLTTR